MVFSMLGCNHLSVIKAWNYRGIPLSVVKVMIRDVLKGLDFLHRKCKIIHTDLKPENVLLQYPHQIAGKDDLAAGIAKLSLQEDPSLDSVPSFPRVVASTHSKFVRSNFGPHVEEADDKAYFYGTDEEFWGGVGGDPGTGVLPRFYDAVKRANGSSSAGRAHLVV